MANVALNAEWKFDLVNKSLSSLGIKSDSLNETKLVYYWTWSAEGAGDGTGSGYASADMDLSSVGNNLYHCIESVHYMNSAAKDIYINTHTDRWINLLTSGQADEQISLWQAAGDYVSFNNRDQIKGIIYLGQPNPKDGDPGLCSLFAEGHTGTAVVNIVVKGFSLDKPLPLRTLYRAHFL